MTQQVRFVKDISLPVDEKSGKSKEVQFSFGNWYEVTKVEQNGNGSDYNLTFADKTYLECCPHECIELYNCDVIKRKPTVTAKPAAPKPATPPVNPNPAHTGHGDATLTPPVDDPPHNFPQ